MLVHTLIDVGEVDEVIDVIVRVCCCHLVRCKSPLSINNELVLVDAPLNRNNKIVLVTFFVHLNPFLPLVECSDDTHVVASKPPSENMIDVSFTSGSFNGLILAIVTIVAAADCILLCCCFEHRQLFSDEV